MAKDDPQELCERLFSTFLGPLVVGGTMLPGKPFGGKRALAIGEHRQPSDVDLLARTELARVRVARRIAPIDTLDAAPSAEEWALAAMLHDLVQSTHPGFDAAFRRSGPKRLLEVIEKTLEHVPAPPNVGAALSRHTWFSRMFELARTDVDLRWWTGSERFLGTDPPKRLLAWPELRRVSETRTPRPLMDLPTSGAAVDLERFTRVTEAFLTKTPLTDLATITRGSPVFRWTRENLELVSTHAGRTLVNRALATLPQAQVDAALGAATKQLFDARAVRALLVAIDLLRDRVLMLATARLGATKPEPLGDEDPRVGFALGAGALAAAQWIAQTGGGFSAAERRDLLQMLAPVAESAAVREIRGLLGA